MKTMLDCKRCTWKQLATHGAYFYGNKAYALVQAKFRKLIREFERRGQTFFLVGEGLASHANYGTILPHSVLTES